MRIVESWLVDVDVVVDGVADALIDAGVLSLPGVSVGAVAMPDDAGLGVEMRGAGGLDGGGVDGGHGAVVMPVVWRESLRKPRV